MGNVLSIVMGYLIGCLSPAAFLGKKQNMDLRQEGTGNLGATNTMIVLGAKKGVFVMLFDIAKAYVISVIARTLFPRRYYAGLLAGCSAILGHIYPCHMNFKGGKGLATFAGMVLALDPLIFLILLVVGLVVMLVVNYGVALPLTGALLLPLIAGTRTGDVMVFTITAIASTLLIIKHWSNIGKAMRGEHDTVRGFLKAKFRNENEQ